MIYLDHAAATPILPEVLDTLNKSLQEDWGNSSSKHGVGKKLSRKLENCRLIVAKSIGASPHQIIFVSSVTEANNLFASILSNNSVIKLKKMIYSDADHSSITKVLSSIDLPHLQLEQWRDFTISHSLIFFSALNSQSGKYIDLQVTIDEIRKQSFSGVIGVDASQYYLRYPIDVKKIDIDFLSLSSHKLGGPKGIAACYIKDPALFSPILRGGGHEYGLRSSTIALPLVMGFSKMIEVWQREQVTWMQHLKELSLFFIEELQNNLTDVIFPFAKDGERSHIILGIFPSVQSDILMRHLEVDNIFVSSTSACGSKHPVNSTVFSALHIEPQYHKNILRFSFAPSTTKVELQYAIKKIIENYKMLIKLKGR